MKTLLIHALRSEAGKIRQYFPRSSTVVKYSGIELIQLNQNFDLLRSGMGMKRTVAALASLPDPSSYQQIIHFGVSGSLASDFPVFALMCGFRFSTENRIPIELEYPSSQTLPDVKPAVFFSSLQPVIDEHSRERALATGAQAVDMESYVVAEFCRDNRIPLLALRCISDRAGSSTIDDFRRNYNKASKKAQDYLLMNLLKP